MGMTYKPDKRLLVIDNITHKSKFSPPTDLPSTIYLELTPRDSTLAFLTLDYIVSFVTRRKFKLCGCNQLPLNYTKICRTIF